VSSFENSAGNSKGKTMKLIFIRHADPDYERDDLTEKGRREAKLLAERVAGMKIDRIYVSPLGRAQATMKSCLDRMDELNVRYPRPIVCDWLREFPSLIKRPDRPDGDSICWDWMPEDWTKENILYDYDKWLEHPVFKNSDTGDTIKYVYSEFEKLLAELGYVREKGYFRVEKPNDECVVFFCHFGLMSVLVSYLTHIPPMPIWQGFITAPTSVTTVYTEERREGKASFRVSAFGDISHLYAAGEAPAFSGRFCELYTNMDERH